LVEDEDYRRGIGERAKAFMDERHCFRCVGERYGGRLGLIGMLRGSSKVEAQRWKVEGERGEDRGRRTEHVREVLYPFQPKATLGN
jgi:hypothetical protein